MISNRDFSKICTDVTKVENYEDALNDQEEKYVLHHVLEWKYSSAELMTMNMYYHRPPEEFLFVKKYVHNSSSFIHIAKRYRVLDDFYCANAKSRSLDTIEKDIDELEEIIKSMDDKNNIIYRQRCKNLDYLKIAFEQKAKATNTYRPRWLKWTLRTDYNGSV